MDIYTTPGEYQLHHLCILQQFCLHIEVVPSSFQADTQHQSDVIVTSY